MILYSAEKCTQVETYKMKDGHNPSFLSRLMNLTTNETSYKYIFFTKMALDAIQILGGNGYINDYPTGRYLRDAKLHEIGAGTSQVRRLVIGRCINAEYK